MTQKEVYSHVGAEADRWLNTILHRPASEHTYAHVNRTTHENARRTLQRFGVLCLSKKTARHENHTEREMADHGDTQDKTELTLVGTTGRTNTQSR